MNVSIGGTLTSFAAPPVLMVASTWGWDSSFMLVTFGWKAAIAVVVNASVATVALRRHLDAKLAPPNQSKQEAIPMAVVAVHLGFLVAVVALAHHPVAFLGLFLLFLGFTQAYERHQNPLIIKEALLVAFSSQVWWCSAECSSGGFSLSCRACRPRCSSSERPLSPR